MKLNEIMISFAITEFTMDISSSSESRLHSEACRVSLPLLLAQSLEKPASRELKALIIKIFNHHRTNGATNGATGRAFLDLQVRLIWGNEDY
jgi:hypothetical protein